MGSRSGIMGKRKITKKLYTFDGADMTGFFTKEGGAVFWVDSTGTTTAITYRDGDDRDMFFCASTNLWFRIKRNKRGHVMGLCCNTDGDSTKYNWSVAADDSDSDGSDCSSDS